VIALWMGAVWAKGAAMGEVGDCCIDTRVRGERDFT
jgi:hypothetical protein